MDNGITSDSGMNSLKKHRSTSSSFFLFLIVLSCFAGIAWADETGYALQTLPFYLTVVVALLAHLTVLQGASAEMRSRWKWSLLFMLIPLGLIMLLFPCGYIARWLTIQFSKLVYASTIVWALIGSLLVFRASSLYKRLLIMFFFLPPLLFIPFLAGFTNHLFHAISCGMNK